eukprot:Platyproteum_vivax@DN1394_c0_g1_i1.p1
MRRLAKVVLPYQLTWKAGLVSHSDLILLKTSAITWGFAPKDELHCLISEKVSKMSNGDGETAGETVTSDVHNRLKQLNINSEEFIEGVQAVYQKVGAEFVAEAERRSRIIERLLDWAEKGPSNRFFLILRQLTQQRDFKRLVAIVGCGRGSILDDCLGRSLQDFLDDVVIAYSQAGLVPELHITSAQASIVDVRTEKSASWTSVASESILVDVIFQTTETFRLKQSRQPPPLQPLFLEKEEEPETEEPVSYNSFGYSTSHMHLWTFTRAVDGGDWRLCNINNVLVP